MIDIISSIVLIGIIIVCLFDMRFHFISSRGYKIMALVGSGCVLILL